ncbi:MAG: MBL fold metallo-hydrolase, partial [Propionibacteriaceae bacterium]
RGTTTAVAIDPYLSNDCEKIYGLQRRRDAPVPAEQLDVRAVCVSHWHEDHLDLPTVQTLLDAGSVLVAPPSCVARLEGRGADPSLLKPILVGQTVTIGDASITAVPARHAVPGYLTEDAVGYVVEIDGARIYHSGDTDYDRSLLEAGVGTLDVALVCINGAGGNMNPVEAAALTAQLRPRAVVGMHIGLWTDAGYGPGATTDPARFAELCAAIAPETRVVVADADVPLEVGSATSV